MAKAPMKKAPAKPAKPGKKCVECGKPAAQCKC